MYSGKLVFSQIMDLVPWKSFRTCVKRYQGDYKVHHLTCNDYYRVMAFAQLTHRESLRDVASCLGAMSSKLYHMGIRSNVSRNNLSNANNTRDWRIFADFAHLLIERAKRLYVDQPSELDLDATVYVDTSVNHAGIVFHTGIGGVNTTSEQPRLNVTVR